MRASPFTIRALTVVLIGCAATAGAGCSSTPTTLFMTVELATAAPAPASVTVSVYDVHHILVMAQPIAAPRLPGTLIIDGLPASSQPLRIAVDSDATTAEEGGVAVSTSVGAQVKASVTLSPTTLDTDHDDVPDVIDNCPTVSNFEQADQLGNGVGDACRNLDGGTPPDGASDGGVRDLSAADLHVGVVDMAARDLLSTDMAVPPVLTCHSLFCDDFETGAWNSSWSQYPDKQATITVDSTHSYSGRYALHLHGNAGAKGYVQPSLENTQGMTPTGAYMRFWVYQATRPPADSLLFYARQINEEPYGQTEVELDGNVLSIGTGGFSQNVPEGSGISLAIGRWVCVEWLLQNNPVDGGTFVANGMQMWVTDPAFAPSPQPVVTTSGPAAYKGFPSWGPILGYSPANGAAAWDVWYDAVAIDNKRIGCN